MTTHQHTARTNSPRRDTRRTANSTFRAGEHLKVWRLGYTHHGIATGEGTVVHYAGLAGGLGSGSAPVCEVSLHEFADDAPVHIVRHASRHFSREQSVARARARVSEDHYSVVGNNCEHFVRWAIDGLHESRQTEAGSGAVAAVSAAGTATGSLTIVGASGTVAGLSGPGIMTGLVAFGPGGAVGGVASLAGAAGVGMNVVLESTVLRDSPGLDDDERHARKVGRWAARGATVASTAGGVGAIALSGSVAGLSGAGITSGLATVGAIAGGGMAAGVGVVVAAPVAAALATGLGATFICRRFRR